MDMEMGFSDEAHTQWTPQKTGESQRRRSKNYSDKEKRVLLDGVEASYDYIKTNTSNPTKDEAWQKIAVEVTALGFAYRNAEDIRLKWTHWSSEVRRKLAKIRATCSPEELGSIDDHLNPLDQRMRALIEGGGTSDPHSGPSTPVRIKEEPHELLTGLPTQDLNTSSSILEPSLQHHYLDQQESKAQSAQSEWHPEEQEHHQQQDNTQGDEREQSWLKITDTYSTAERRSYNLKRQAIRPKQSYSRIHRKRRRVQNQLDIAEFGEIDDNFYDEEGEFHEEEFHNDAEYGVSEMVNGINGDVSQNYCSHTTNKPHSKEMSMAQTQRELLEVSKEISGTLKLLLEQQIKMNTQLDELLKRQNNTS